MKVTVSWGPKVTSGTFQVAGADLEQAARALSGRDEWGSFVGRISYRWNGDAQGNALSVKLDPAFKIMMPVWRAYRNQPQECKDEWDAMWRALREHEDGHRTIFENDVASLTGKLESLTGVMGTEVDKFIKKEQAAIQRRQDLFDRKTDHGRSRGVELTISEKCSSK